MIFLITRTPALATYQSCEFVLFLSGGGLTGGDEHVWLFTRRDLLPLLSTPFHMLHVALQCVRVQVNCLLWLEIEQAEHTSDVYMHE